jgi:hypothetical protein
MTAKRIKKGFLEMRPHLLRTKAEFLAVLKSQEKVVKMKIKKNLYELQLLFKKWADFSDENYLARHVDSTMGDEQIWLKIKNITFDNAYSLFVENQKNIVSAAAISRDGTVHVL